MSFVWPSPFILISRQVETENAFTQQCLKTGLNIRISTDLHLFCHGQSCDVHHNLGGRQGTCVSKRSTKDDDGHIWNYANWSCHFSLPSCTATAEKNNMFLPWRALIWNSHAATTTARCKAEKLCNIPHCCCCICLHLLIQSNEIENVCHNIGCTLLEDRWNESVNSGFMCSFHIGKCISHLATH